MKNTFKYEINESMQAHAAMNCIRNRNNHKQINEVAPVVAAAGRRPPDAVATLTVGRARVAVAREG